MIKKFAKGLLGPHAYMVDKDLPIWEALYSAVPASDRAEVEALSDEDIFLMSAAAEKPEVGLPFFRRDNGDSVTFPHSIDVIIQSMYDRYVESPA